MNENGMNETKIDLKSDEKPTTIMDAVKAVEQNNNGTKEKPTINEALKKINNTIVKENGDARIILKNVDLSTENAKATGLSDEDLNKSKEELKAMTEELQNMSNPDYSKFQGEDAWGDNENETPEEVQKENKPNLNNTQEAVREGYDEQEKEHKEVVSAITVDTNKNEQQDENKDSVETESSPLKENESATNTEIKTEQKNGVNEVTQKNPSESEITVETGKKVGNDEVTEAVFDFYNRPPINPINNDKVSSLGETTKEVETQSNEVKQQPSEKDFTQYLRLRANLGRYNRHIDKRGGKDNVSEGARKGAEEAENKIKEHTGGQDWEKMYPDQIKKAEEKHAKLQDDAEKKRVEEQKLWDEKREKERAEVKDILERKAPQSNQDGKANENESKEETEGYSDLEKNVETLTKLIEGNNERMQKLEARLADIDERLNKLAEKMEAMSKTPEQETEKPSQQAENNNTTAQQQEQKPTPMESQQNIKLEGLSEEAAEWKIKEAALKNKLYAANNAWVKNKNSSDYNTYLKTYNELARHNTNAWHNDGLMNEGVYKPYETTNPRPEIENINRSITLSGNLVFNELKPEKIKQPELTDIAKTLMWERQKNPAVVDFQFAGGFRVNLWQMRNETRELIEKKIVELGGNNYEKIKPSQPVEAGTAASGKGAETTSLGRIPESYKEAYQELLKTGEEIKKTKKEVEKQKKAYNLTLDIVSNLYSGKNVNEYVLDDLEKYEMSDDEAAEFINKLKGAGFYTGQNKDTGKYYVRRRF